VPVDVVGFGDLQRVVDEVASGRISVPGSGGPMQDPIRCFAHPATGRLHVEWTVGAHKLRPADKQTVSQAFQLPHGGRLAAFKMLLHATPRGASFEQSKGKGSVAVKCLTDGLAGVGSLTYWVYVRGGDRAQPPRGPITNDFHKFAVSSLPRDVEEWDFAAVADGASQTFIVGLEVQL
jgi:hypothetical protein